MSASAGRSAVFLAEMGVGPLWQLRQSAVNAASAVDAEINAEIDAEIGAEIGAETDAGIGADTALAAVLDIVAPAALAPTPVTQIVAAPANVAEAAPTLPQRLPVAPALPALDDGSTAWFDDAPAPIAPVAVTDAAIAAMDWPALKAAAARCTRCALSRSRKHVVFGRGDVAAGWLVVGAGPTRGDEKEGRAIAGEAGTLLDNMLLAIGLNGDKDVYVTNLLKCRPQGPDGAERAPSPEELTACRPYLERELALTQARTIVTLGQPALRGLLGNTVPAAARGSVHRLGAAAVVATYHPDDLLRQGDAKARAWADLCLAKSAHIPAGPEDDSALAKSAHIPAGTGQSTNGDAA